MVKFEYWLAWVMVSVFAALALVVTNSSVESVWVAAAVWLESTLP